MQRVSNLVLKALSDFFGTGLHIDSLCRHYANHKYINVPLSYEDSQHLAAYTRESDAIIKFSNQGDIAEIYRIISIIDAAANQTFLKKNDPGIAWIEKIFHDYSSQLRLHKFKKNDFFVVGPSIFYLCVKQALSYKWRQHRGPSKRKRASQQRSLTENNILEFKYHDRPVIVYRQEILTGFCESELSSAMFLNLAARRKANNPPGGLAHKRSELLDDTIGYKNFNNLRRSPSALSLSDLVRAHRDSSGKLMRDHKVYLHIDANRIFIDDSIAQFESSHRIRIGKYLNRSPEPGSPQVKNYARAIGSTLKFLRRNELLVDDAFFRIDKSELRLGSRQKLKSIDARVHAILQTLGLNIQDYLLEDYEQNTISL